MTNHETPQTGFEERQAEVLSELKMNKTYELTKDELKWGARMAWRNAPRCPARIIWKKQQVFDARNIDDLRACLRQFLSTWTTVTMEETFGQQ